MGWGCASGSRVLSSRVGLKEGKKGEGYLYAPPAQTRRRGPYTFRSRVLCVRGTEEGQKVGGVPFRASCANEGAAPLHVPFVHPVSKSCSRMSRGWGRKGGVRWRVREGGKPRHTQLARDAFGGLPYLVVIA